MQVNATLCAPSSFAESVNIGCSLLSLSRGFLRTTRHDGEMRGTGILEYNEYPVRLTGNRASENTEKS